MLVNTWRSPLCSAGAGTNRSGGGLASVLAHAIGHRSNVANGIVNAILLPWTMRFNASATQHTTRRIAESLRTAPGGNADGAVETLQLLLDRLNIPRRLRDIGLAQADLEHVADAAMSDWFISRAPRPISSPHQLRGILESAW